MAGPAPPLHRPQAVLETVRQVGLDITTDVTLYGVRGHLGASYTLESVQNRDLNPSAPAELNQVFGLSLSVGF